MKSNYYELRCFFPRFVGEPLLEKYHVSDYFTGSFLGKRFKLFFILLYKLIFSTFIINYHLQNCHHVSLFF